MKRLNLDRRLITILVIVFVQMAGAAMVLPILPLFAQREFDLSPAVIAILISSFFAAQFFAGPFLGRLSDQYGRLPILILSQLGTAASFVVLALAGSAWMLFVARVVDGVTGGNIIVAQAYITDITPREKRTAALGYIFAIFGLGFIIGPALGGVLSAAFGPRIPFLLAAGAAVVAVIMTVLFLEETVEQEQRTARRTRGKRLALADVTANTPLLIILFIAFMGQAALGLIQSTFALYGEAVLFQGYDDEAVNLGVGLLLAAVGVGQLFTQMALLERMLQRWHEIGLVYVGSGVRAGALFLFAVVASPWLGAAASLLFAVGQGLLMPSLQSLATETVDDETRGGVLGFYQSSVSLATIISTAIGGLLFEIGPTVPYWIGGMLAIVVLLPALLLPRQLQGEHQPVENVQTS
ncbi:MAG: MFS transporter [Candidatus Promineifilaceae bacterium]|nr:MFS transporter [Candidatus Promineifilaceae bacterium]